MNTTLNRVPTSRSPAPSVTSQPSGGGLSVDGRFKPFSVEHTDSKKRTGMYVDQSAPFKALYGDDGKPKAVAYTAGLAVDTDGEGSHHGDATAGDQTSLQIRGRSANADKLPYVALPPGFAKAMGAKLGDVVQVTAPNGNTAYALYADNSDDGKARKLGEGSPELLRALGYKGSTLDPNKGGLESGVKFVAFPGSGKALGTTRNGFPSTEQVQAWGQQLAAQVGGSAPVNGTPQPGSDKMTPPAQPRPVEVNPSAPHRSVVPSSAPSLDEVASGDGLIKLGQKGEGVQQVQLLLGLTGEAADGIFGMDTEMAVTKFQQQHGLEADGVVGPRTLAALNASAASGAGLLKQGASGEQVTHLQQQLKQAGFDPGEVDGKFGPKTEAALKAFQQAKDLDVDGVAGPKTFGALARPGAVTPGKAPTRTETPSTREAPSTQATSSTNGAVLGNGYRIDTNNPLLKKLATSPLNDGPTGYCVRTTLDNMKRLGIPHTPEATGADPNNPRGGLAQMLRNGGWASVPLPGSRQETLHSNYGTATANVVSASQYKKLVQEGKIPDGAIIFQTRHGWDWSQGSKGNDMGIVRNHGNTTHNYKSMSSIIYSDCKDVVILVPKDALQRAN